MEILSQIDNIIEQGIDNFGKLKYRMRNDFIVFRCLNVNGIEKNKKYYHMSTS